MLYSYACSYKARVEARVKGDAEYIPNKLQFSTSPRYLYPVVPVRQLLTIGLSTETGALSFCSGLGSTRSGSRSIAVLVIPLRATARSKRGNSGGLPVLPSTSIVAFRSNIGISTRNVCTLYVQCLGRDSLFLVTL